MDFNKGGHSVFLRKPQKITQHAGREGRHNEQDGIGAGGAALHNLPWVYYKVSAQKRQGNDLTDVGEIVEFPLKVGFIGEHGEASGTVFGIGFRYGDRVEVGSNDTF